jgi:nucleotide-binding universal stress UspA family protein
MENKKLILVPTDFSEVCENAIIYGAKMAAFLGYELALLHIVDKKSKAELLKEKQDITEINKKLDTLAKKIAKKYEIEVSSLHREGSIFTDIGIVAKEIKANLLVLGTHGKVGLKQKLSGSFAKKVVTTSPVPVIVVQKGTKFNKTFKNIVFPISTTAEVRQKVSWAVMIAGAFKSKIHLFQLHETSVEDKKTMSVIINQITKEFDKNDIKYILVPAEKGKNFGTQVIEYAVKQKADLITVMTTPDSIDFILGPYDEKLIFNPFEIPVMCVNPVQTKIMHWL